MTDKPSNNDSLKETFTSDAVRQRWELFHRAIAFAKQSNSTALQESEIAGEESKPHRGSLSIAR